jgi:hypothetical protein
MAMPAAPLTFEPADVERLGRAKDLCHIEPGLEMIQHQDQVSRTR